jgi:hypothetical protein
LGVASGAFGSARQGFESFSEQMQAGVTRQNEERTNAHIRAALEGNPLPADSRVDPTAVQDAVEQQKKAKSDELSAIMIRTGQGISQAKDTKELSVFDERFTAEMEGEAASTARDVQGTATDAARLTAIQGQESRRASSQAKSEEIDRGWSAILDDSIKRQEGEVEGILGRLREKDPTITDRELDRIRRDEIMPQIRTRAAQEQGEQAISYEAEVRSRLAPDAATFDNTTFGQITANQRGLAQKDASEGRHEEKAQAKRERAWAVEAENGDMTKMIPTSTGFRTITTAGEGERNSIPVKNAKGVASYMKSRHRVELDDEELQLAYKALQAVGGNKRAFEALLEVKTKDKWFWFTGDYESVDNWKDVLKAAGSAGTSMRAEATRLGKEATRVSPSALSAEDFTDRLVNEIADSRFLEEEKKLNPDKVFQNLVPSTGTINR